MTTSTTQVFNLPDLGEGLREAEIVRWLVAIGDEVTVDQSIVEVETAKSIVEVPSPYTGRVGILHGAEGETLDVGSPLITIDAPATIDPPVVQRPAAQADGSAAGKVYREEERAGSGNVLIGYGTAESSGSGRRRRPRAPTSATPQAGKGRQAAGRETARVPRSTVPLVISPLVRALAREHGVGLATIDPTGVGGVITRADVEKAVVTSRLDSWATASQPASRSAAGERRTPLTTFRKAVSATLARSRAEIPEATVWVDVDATPLWELRESARTPQDPGPGLMAYLARFVVAALQEYPVLNARLDTERQEIVEFDRVNLGIAVQSDRGLVVPAVIGAETMTTSRLDEEIRTVTGRAREGRSTPEELTAGTFTLNNYGSFRVDGSAAIINHPQVAILGFGRVIDRPWVVDGELCVRKITQMSFVFDHRVCDGGTAADFMRSVADAVENPASVIARL